VFANRPLEDARNNRPDLLVAALTIIRAHIVAGRPCTGNLGSFEDWAQLVVGALLWLGEPDPIRTRDELVVEDPEKAKFDALLATWRDKYGFTEQRSTTVFDQFLILNNAPEKRTLKRGDQRGFGNARRTNNQPEVRHIPRYQQGPHHQRSTVPVANARREQPMARRKRHNTRFVYGAGRLTSGEVQC
jgi:hypothetical protein